MQGKGHFTTLPKNATSVREISLDKSLIGLLKNKHKMIGGYSENFIVFGATKYLADETVRRHQRKYTQLANVKNIRLHDFRHSHASWLINNGANIVLVAKRLGHKDTQMTLNTYTHLFPNQEHEILSLIES